MRCAQRALLAFSAACMVLSLSSCSSCSRSSSPTGPSSVSISSPAPTEFYTPPGAVFEATYTPNTIRIDFPTVKKALRSVSDDARVFLFDASDSRIRALAKGKVMFLEHLGVRKVDDVMNQGSQIAVLTEMAGLPDFIQEGRIQFKAPIDFRRATSHAMLLPPSDGRSLMGNLGAWFGHPHLVYAGGDENAGSIGIHTKGEINDWEYELKGEPEGHGFKLSLEAGKKIKGFTASVKANGNLENVTTAFDAVIHGGKMEELEYNTPLSGKLHVGWAALTEGENTGIGEARLKLPPFAKDVIDVYGVPLLFKVDEALIFKPGFGGKKDAGEGGFNLTYDGTGGLSVHGEKSTPEGSMDAEPSLEKTTTESLAAHGIVLAIDAPKISISLGTESILEAIKESMPAPLLDKAAKVLENGPFGLGGLVKKTQEDFFKLEGAAYVQLVTEFDFAGSGPLSLVPCTMTHLNFYAQAGADAQLGVYKGESPKMNIKETKLTVRNPDIDACGKKEP